MSTSTVLFMAEDDPVIRRMYERAFANCGYQLEMATDGEEALMKLEKMDPPPTLVILDIMMPRINGFDVLRKIKQGEKYKNVPVVVLTNLSEPADEKKALDLGAIAYLVKSQYDPKEVIEIVKAQPAYTAEVEKILSVLS